jgi:phosphoribosylanthranilate isomerase
MKRMMNKAPIIQVAGVTAMDEAMMLAASGITHLGFPFRLDFHNEDLTEAEAAEIIRMLPSSVIPVLITYLVNAGEIANLMKKLGCKVVQLHGSISIDEIKKLKMLFPEAEIWKSLVIGKYKFSEILEIAKSLNPFVDAFITDTYDAKTGASGATGKTHDWNLSRKVIGHSSKPVIIAGGLNPANVHEAILQTQPAGVDVHTGVEGLDGIKDKQKVEEFVKEAKKAFEVLAHTR